MTSRVKVLTGAGTSSATYGVVATDLGIPRMLPNGRIGYVFGDTWSDVVGGANWRSPVMLYSDDTTLADLNAGIDFHGAVGGATASQLWAYTHDGPPWTNGGFSTVLPSDTLVIGSRTYLFAMVNKGLGSVIWSEIQYSDDSGATWTLASGSKKDGDYLGGMQQHVTWEYDSVTDYVYIYSTGFQRDKNAFLFRVRPVDLLDRDKWEGWGWNGVDWGWGRPPTEVFPVGTKLGEMCLRKIQNNWVLTYLDLTDPGNVKIRAKVMGVPNGNLHTAFGYAIVSNVGWGLDILNPGNLLPQPYGGYIVPGSTLAELHVVCSQWNTTPGGGNTPYRSLQFKTAVFPVNPI